MIFGCNLGYYFEKLNQNTKKNSIRFLGDTSQKYLRIEIKCSLNFHQCREKN